MPAYLIHYPKGHGEDVLAEDPALTLEFTDGWAVLVDEAGPCMAIPAQAGATITRVDPEDQQPEE